MPATLKKDPSATLDFAVGLSAWLAEGEALATVTFDVPEGLTKGAEAVNAAPVTDADGVEHAAGTAGVVWLSGGEHNARYTVTCRWTTDAGRADERDFDVWVLNRTIPRPLSGRLAP
ncbi:MAG TPA: hypothetical protein VD838_01800 [Anaeromyxobacteraceae bacterium]|nr:hypothetical protein [Anaeromyxobacteraceae bacterium]